MPNIIKIRSGIDIKLTGKAEQVYASSDMSETFALKPTDFAGIRSKLCVKQGDEVKAGTPLFYSKDHESIKFCSPGSGEVVEILRGAKRKILEVRILADKEIQYEDFEAADPKSLDREAICEKMLISGCWPFIRQRPYNVVANPERTPKAIFISCFDTAPLAPKADFTVHRLDEEFQIGISALGGLTDGKIHLGVDSHINPDSVFMNCRGVDIHRFEGPHPAGNVGVHIHHIDPINKGDTVWTVHCQDVISIGRLFLEGRFRTDRNIAVVGSEVLKPRYYKTIIGNNIKSFVRGNVTDGNLRYISGNVLTGTKIRSDGYLGFYSHQLTVIPEGDQERFFGWISPNLDSFSISRTLFSWMFPNKAYRLNTGMNGEERAYVVTGEYERVFPFDIYPVQLIKSIMAKDIEAMEDLGIYEIVEEDFALCEVVCTSKIPVQKTIREGLDLMLKELGD